jgi:curved DNA-binding protein CbpA
MQNGIDHYAVLGLAPSADDVVVHAAWKALLRKHHPDTNPDDPSGARAREINEAFAVLGKPAARANYDRMRGHRPEIPPVRHPPYEGPRFREPPRRRFSATGLFGATLLTIAALPIAIATLLAFPATRPTTHEALAWFSAGSPFAEDLVSRLDAVANGLTGGTAAHGGDADAGNEVGNGESGPTD